MTIKAPVISLVDGQVVMAARSIYLEADKRERVELMAGLEERVFVVIVDAAKLDSAEVLQQILLTHEEGTIISI